MCSGYAQRYIFCLICSRPDHDLLYLAGGQPSRSRVAGAGLRLPRPPHVQRGWLGSGRDDAAWRPAAPLPAGTESCSSRYSFVFVTAWAVSFFWGNAVFHGLVIMFRCTWAAVDWWSCFLSTGNLCLRCFYSSHGLRCFVCRTRWVDNMRIEEARVCVVRRQPVCDDAQA